MNEKIKGLIGLTVKSGHAVIGQDNLKAHKQKLFLVLLTAGAGENLISLAKNVAIKNGNNADVVMLNFNLSDVIPTCKIVGIKNKGLAEAILKLMRG